MDNQTDIKYFIKMISSMPLEESKILLKRIEGDIEVTGDNLSRYREEWFYLNERIQSFTNDRK